MVLVRPDGFIGFRRASADDAAMKALDTHLSTYLQPELRRRGQIRRPRPLIVSRSHIPMPCEGETEDGGGDCRHGAARAGARG